ncbi:hypothetical protein [Clostridium beijerinckii]|uniref:DNA-binding protein (UPF0251 family) n=1 Tax=Clostridium beijerinckii TaxID=1520 RepID=A0AAE5H782_CLOBE|nr:hypothetical protein [Clostridium beijerinckii]NOW85328.1 putative DNA-binding protein (UPF0251 family) [Clostridium beijerinckii]NSB16475.1 putative DNA-binding protein (UPF0251 family) [Clostridium beijerinckii]OOM25680.1 hypothetical protein CLOBE_34750 [Clostridium beijerinckii]
MDKFIEKELELYSFRKVEVIDMELKIKELEVRDQIAAMNYEERVQTSVKCKNNDFIINLIDSYKKKIEINKLSNLRIDNILSILDNEEEEVIRKMFIDKKSKTKTAREMKKSRKGVEGLLKKAIERIDIINERIDNIEFEEELLKIQ